MLRPMDWRTDLRDLLDEARYPTQQALVRALAKRGHRVHQATVSRELDAVGAVKEDGAYRLAAEPLPAPVLGAALAAGGALVVLRTLPAHAAVLAQVVDRAGIDGVVGTIAGDDTVFCALAGPEAWSALRRRLRLPAVSAATHQEPR
jgi:transcriptional regulator of arginine metabolism